MRVLAINDISCVGRCSLTATLPIVSACGITCDVLPTALLSTHTGGFTGYTHRDLTSDMRPMADHWKSLDLKFDALYSGYLGSFEQIEIVKSIVKDFKSDDNFFLCDPAMADHGKMYALFDMDFAKKMAELCSLADIIVPNFTEAAFMTGEEYKEGPYTKEYVNKYGIPYKREHLNIPPKVLEVEKEVQKPLSRSKAIMSGRPASSPV